jgi:hypothetical protein
VHSTRDRDVRLAHNPALDSWNRSVDHYIDQALAPNTQKLYSTGWKTFRTFLQLSDIKDIFGVTDTVRQKTMMAFTAYCADSLCISYTTIKSYLCAIKYFFARSGSPDPLTFTGGQSFTQLQLVLRGVRKVQGSVTNKREPVTIDLLSSMIRVLGRGLYGPYMDSLLTAAFLLAFFGFLRCSEFTTISDHFDPVFHLTMSCVSIVSLPQKMLYLSLHASKTDPFRKGVTIKIFPLNNYLCPIQAVTKFLTWRKSLTSSPNSPFFLTTSGTPLTRKVFTNCLQGVLQCVGQGVAGIKPHSFRIGAATSAAKANIPDHLIKTMGRWSSDCYLRYIHTSLESLAQAQRQLVRQVP